MLIIATDEAGYGPKLGPLVIAASSWRIDGDRSNEVEKFFAPLGRSVTVDGHVICIDDSKLVYKPGDSLERLHAIVSVASHLSGQPFDNFTDFLQRIAPEDVKHIHQLRWYGQFDTTPCLTKTQAAPAISAWQTDSTDLLGVAAKIITAAQFNRICDSGLNKADLLSQHTLALARRSLEAAPGEPAMVYCDRHGGRRYYAAVIQHVFPEGGVTVLSESKTVSRYACDWRERRIEFAFTVKGDRFGPVALSSLHAKYIRERMMESFNRHFAKLHQAPPALKPTAGYPVDADRFLQEIASLIKDHRIDLKDLVRQR